MGVCIDKSRENEGVSVVIIHINGLTGLDTGNYAVRKCNSCGLQTPLKPYVVARNTSFLHTSASHRRASVRVVPTACVQPTAPQISPNSHRFLS